jgi:zinc protease
LPALIRLLALVAICAIPAGALAGPAMAAPSVQQFTLDNGMLVVVVPDHRTPVVTHMLWYRIGAADEPYGKSGIAHFLEHLMFKGTAKNPAGHFSQRIAAVGGQENAFTSYDYTGYYQRVSRENLGAMMEFEADRMTGLVLAEDVIASERNVILEERNQRIDNEPSARLSEQVQAAQYLNHPYHRPSIGWRHEMETLNREDALSFYGRYYQPDNAFLIIAGDVTLDEVKALAEKTYGKIEKRTPLGPRIRPSEPPQIVERRLTFADLRVTQPSLQRSYLVPSFTTAKSNEGDALEMLAYVLGGGANSRLYRSLVIEKRLATNVGSWYQGTSLDVTRFGIYGTAAAGVPLEKVEAAIDAEIEALLDTGPTAEELERSKSRLIADFVYAQDNQSRLVQLYGAALATGLTVKSVLERPERLRAVTAEQVRDVARRYLEKRHSVTGYLVKDAAPRGLVKDTAPREEKKS